MAFINRMKGQDYIDKTREYLNYLEEHLENVRRAFCELSDICVGMHWWVMILHGIPSDKKSWLMTCQNFQKKSFHNTGLHFSR
jgi:hypothetical protein